MRLICAVVLFLSLADPSYGQQQHAIQTEHKNKSYNVTLDVSASLSELPLT